MARKKIGLIGAGNIGGELANGVAIWAKPQVTIEIAGQ